MLVDFFFALKDAKIPVSIKEFLILLEALQKQVIGNALDEFYYLARTTLVKDEAHYDKFDQAFGLYFHGINTLFEKNPEIPLDWLMKRMQREMTPEQRAALEKFGYDKLMDRLKELMQEQKERHEGGNKWIGTGGTSPFGNGGENPEGIRIGGEGGKRSAVKVWEARAFRDYDSERELGTRNIKVALRRLRRFAREGAQEELALDDTIRATANNAGWLDLKMQAERKNKIKVLMLMDVGGTMDDHIARAEELFSAAKAGRLGGIQQRRSWRGLVATIHQHLSKICLAQSRTRRAVAVPSVDCGNPTTHGQPDVSRHNRRARASDGHVEQIVPMLPLQAAGLALTRRPNTPPYPAKLH
jgi:uncharacterized protein with von Willebrand factor type A (vWA) domain